MSVMSYRIANSAGVYYQFCVGAVQREGYLFISSRLIECLAPTCKLVPSLVIAEGSISRPFFMLHLFLVTPSQARALLSARHRRHLASAPYSAVEGVCRKAQAPTGEMAILVKLFLNLGWPTQTYLGA